jgi:hypothetical protein
VESAAKLDAIIYGVELPDDLVANMAEVLGYESG